MPHAPSLTFFVSTVNLVLVILLTLTLKPAAAGPTDLTWQPVNAGLPTHDQALAFAFDPADPRRLLVGLAGSGNLHRSTDAGTTWQPSNTGFTGQPVYALQADPRRPGTVLAGSSDGLWRSTDGGRTWRPLTLPGTPQPTLYALAANQAGDVFAGGSSDRMWRSRDGGVTWQLVGTLPGQTTVLSLLATPDNTLLAGTTGQGVYRSTDAGRTWAAGRGMAPTFVASLVAVTRDGQTVLARGRQGLWRSRDGGQTWQALDPDVAGRVDALAAGDSASSPSRVMLITDRGTLYRSTDAGTGWQPWGTGLGRGGAVSFLRAQPGDPDTLFAGAETGLYRSRDGGLTWEAANTGIGTPPARSLAQATDGTLILAHGDGVFVFDPRRASWQARSQGLPAGGVYSVAAAPSDPQILYAGTVRGGLARSTNGGTAWEVVDPQRTALAIAIDPRDAQHVYVRQIYERIYESRDGGRTWQAHWAGFELNTEIVSLTIDPCQPDTLWAGSTQGLFRSDDAGRTWAHRDTALAGQTVFGVLTDCGNPNWAAAGATKGAYVSRAGGETWPAWGRGLQDITVTTLVRDPAAPQVLYAGTRYQGLYRSSDGGVSWAPAGLAGSSIHGLLVDRGGAWLWAVTSQGVLRAALDSSRAAGDGVPPAGTRAAFTEDQPVPEPAVVPAAKSAEPPLRYAVHTLPADARSLALAHEAGFDTIVQLFSWREIEPTRGQYHWQVPDEIVQGAAYYGLDLVVRLDQHPTWASAVPTSLNAPPDRLVDYIDFVSTVASRYRGRVLGYVIWNEPNLAIDWGGQPPDPAAYTVLLKAAYRAIKAADPGARVVSAGLAPTNQRDAQALDDREFLEAMYRAGAGDYFDVLGAHPYGFAYPPDDPRGAHDSLNFARLHDLRAIMLAHGDAGKPVWATEFGWTVRSRGNAAWLAVTPAQQAAYLVQALRLAADSMPWLGMLSIWNLGGEQHPDWGGYSLRDPAGQPRPAYRAVQRYLATVEPADTPTPSSFQRYPVLAPDALVHLGDTDFPPPWMPLYGVRNPSTTWQGTVYLPDPGTATWRLTMRVMQSNVWGNTVSINGTRLAPPLPQEDFSGSWVSYTWTVPAGLLRPGANTIGLTIGLTTPVMQDAGWRWDDLQVKDMVMQF